MNRLSKTVTNRTVLLAIVVIVALFAVLTLSKWAETPAEPAARQQAHGGG